MSDRYYRQMGEHFGLSPWELQIALTDKQSELHRKLEKKSMGKVTRKDLNSQLTEIMGKDIAATKLPLETLQELVASFKTKKFKAVPVPNGRLKAPYISALTESLGKELDFSTATVAVMTKLLEWINE